MHFNFGDDLAKVADRVEMWSIDKKAQNHEGGLEKPSRVKWFRDKGLDVIDVAASLRSGIVRTRAADGTEAFYGLPYIATHDEDDDEDNHKGLFEET